MVALAPEIAPGPVEVARGDVAVVVGPRVLEGVGDDAGAVYALPLEQVVREVVGLVPVELVGEKAREPRAAQELREAGRVAEGVGEPGDRAAAAEGVLEVSLAVEELAHEGLAGGDLAVRLDPRASHRLPPALRDPLLYPPEQPGVVVLDPTVQLGRGLVEDEVLVAVHEAEDAGERAPRLPPRLRDGPEPREVQVRVAREREPPDRRIVLLYPPETGLRASPRAPRTASRASSGNGANGSGGGRQAPGLAEVTVDVHELLGVGRRQAARRIPRGPGEAFEVAGQGHVRGGRPGRGEDRRGGVERVEQARHRLVVVEGGAGLEDGREVPLQRPHLRLRDDQPRQLQARLGDVRAEHALRDDLGLDTTSSPPRASSSTGKLR